MVLCRTTPRIPDFKGVNRPPSPLELFVTIKATLTYTRWGAGTSRTRSFWLSTLYMVPSVTPRHHCHFYLQSFRPTTESTWVVQSLGTNLSSFTFYFIFLFPSFNPREKYLRVLPLFIVIYKISFSRKPFLLRFLSKIWRLSQPTYLQIYFPYFPYLRPLSISLLGRRSFYVFLLTMSVYYPTFFQGPLKPPLLAPLKSVLLCLGEWGSFLFHVS